MGTLTPLISKEFPTRLTGDLLRGFAGDVGGGGSAADGDCGGEKLSSGTAPKPVRGFQCGDEPLGLFKSACTRSSFVARCERRYASRRSSDTRSFIVRQCQRRYASRMMFAVSAQARGLAKLAPHSPRWLARKAT
jgi:hypothetical protein